MMKRYVCGLLGVAVLTLGGCGWGQSTEEEPAGSGDPEADQRAEMRVGATDGRKATREGKDGEKRVLTLYERLGGEAGVRRLVDEFTPRVVNDPRVNFTRTGVKSGLLRREREPWAVSDENVAHFKDRMVEFISLAAGGPAQYQGRDMGPVHKGMGISNSEFDAMIGDIKTSMERLGIKRQEQKELIAIFETTRREIVEED